VTRDTLVGELAARHPLATRVFARHHIDFCCGGGRPLGDVCELQGLNVDTIVDEIGRELAPKETIVRWDLGPVGDLIDHILNKYHAGLYEELPRLEAMARKVEQVHGEKDPQRLNRLVQAVLELKAELDTHMIKEEQILFPMIRAGRGTGADGPIAVMMREHETAGDLLRQIRELTNDYTVPEDACNTWRALWLGLEALEADLHEHIHLENNILFPRALDGV
jgi:regulator of cell morphogenesis and NO signaling